MLNQSLLLPGAHKRRRGGFSRLGYALSLDQKQFAVSEFEKGLATLRIGTPAEHLFTASRSAKNSLGEPLNSPSPARALPRGFPPCQGIEQLRFALNPAAQ